MITQDRLKEVLHYEAETGVFTWIKSTANKAKIGTVAGSFNTEGYRRIVIDKKEYRENRLAWLYVYGFFPGEEVDHINRVKDDNRIANLRMSTGSMNCRNKGINSRNTSNITGVSWNKVNRNWIARIVHHGKRKWLGAFKNKEDAIAIRREWEERLGYL